MAEPNTSYVVAVAEQLSFVSAFLGGISATILVTIVVFTSPKKSASWIVSSSAFAACSLLVAVVASWRLTIMLHPDFPMPVNTTVVNVLWNGMLIGYSLGFLSLIVSIGLSGWLRTKKSGFITTAIASIAVIFFVLATPFGF